MNVCPKHSRARVLYRFTVANKDGSDAKSFVGFNCGHQFKLKNGAWVPIRMRKQ